MTKPITIVLDADTGKAQVKIGRATSQISGDFGKMSKAVDDSGKSWLKADESVKRAAKSLAKISAIAAGATAAAITAVAIKGAEFEYSLQKVGNIAGASGDQLESLSRRARELGKTTAFTASQVTEGMQALASLGMKVDDVNMVIEDALKLAGAYGSEISVASEAIAVAMNNLNMGIEDTQKITDILAVTLKNSLFPSLGELSIAFKEATLAAGPLGYSIEETVSGLRAFRNAGIEAQRAGTHYKMMLNQLAKPSANMHAALEKIGLSYEKINPLTHQATDILSALAETTITLTDANLMFGEEAGASVMSVIKAIQNGKVAFDDFNQALEESTNTVSDDYKKMMETLKGQWAQLTSAIEGVMLDLFDAYKEPLTKAVIEVRKKVEEIGKYLSDPATQRSIKDFFETALKLAKELAKAIEQIAGYIIEMSRSAAAAAENLRVAQEKMPESVGAWKKATVGMSGAIAWLVDKMFVSREEMAKNRENTEALTLAMQMSGESIHKMYQAFADKGLIEAARRVGIEFTQETERGRQAYEEWSSAIERGNAILDSASGKLQELGIDFEAIRTAVEAADGPLVTLGAQLEAALPDGYTFSIDFEANKLSINKIGEAVEEAVVVGGKEGAKKSVPLISDEVAKGFKDSIPGALGSAIFAASASGGFEEFMSTVNMTLFEAVKQAVEQAFVQAIINKQIIDPLVSLLQEIDISTTDGLSKWMAEARDAVGQASRQFEALWPVVKMVQEEFSFLAPEVEQATDALSGAADYAGTQIDDLGTRSSVLAEDFGGLGSAAMDAASGLRAAAQEASQGVGGTPKGGGFSGKWDPVRQSWQTESGSVKADEWGQLWYYPGKQYATGTEHVAKTGPAIVHEGEKIIRKQESSRSGGSMTLQFNITALDPVGMKKVVRDSIMPELQRAAARGWA